MARFRATLTLEGGGEPVVLEEDVTAAHIGAAADPAVDALKQAAAAAGFEPGSKVRARSATRITFEIRKLGA